MFMSLSSVKLWRMSSWTDVKVAWIPIWLFRLSRTAADRIRIGFQYHIWKRLKSELKMSDSVCLSVHTDTQNHICITYEGKDLIWATFTCCVHKALVTLFWPESCVCTTLGSFVRLCDCRSYAIVLKRSSNSVWALTLQCFCPLRFEKQTDQKV